MPQYLTDHESTLVQVMVWCRQATKHYLSQCWSRSLSPYDITRPQWVNSSPPGQNGRHWADNIFKCIFLMKMLVSLQWCHNDHNRVSNHLPHGCLLNRLFRRRSKKTSKLHVTGLCVGNSPGPVNSPHKGPVTQKMFPFDDVIMFDENFNEVCS